MSKKVVVFDLDDTLYKEIDFLKSGYHAVAEWIGERFAIDAGEVEENLHMWRKDGKNPFEMLISHYAIELSVSDCLDVYRNHKPTLTLNTDVYLTLEALRNKGCVIGIITDGRSVTQRNKVEALGLMSYIDPDDLLISEETGHPKPSVEPFQHFMRKYPDAKKFMYIGDNPAKDFLAIKQLGWTTVCVKDDGRNIHPQDVLLDDNYFAKYLISSPS